MLLLTALIVNPLSQIKLLQTPMRWGPGMIGIGTTVPSVSMELAAGHLLTPQTTSPPCPLTPTIEEHPTARRVDP
jgi:hypothetical protein